jgi:MFS family permease
MFGVMGDRIGHRRVLCVMRLMYAVLASVLMVAALLGQVTPMLVLAVTALLGLVKPSDIGMRTALVGETMPSRHLMAAMGIQRTTQDSARIAGALSGAGLVALLGMGQAYVVVVAFYGLSVALTLKAGGERSTHQARAAQQATPLRDLREGLGYVWRTPHLKATMLFAFLLNLTAFPLFTGLMPYVAKEVYGATQTTLGTLVASAASGSLIGSIFMSRFGNLFPPARAMLVFGALWLSVMVVFAQTRTPAAGMPVLFVAGLMQTMCLIPISALLLRSSDERYRGRIMGIRMLAIYGNLPGLLLAAPLIAHFGYTAMATIYCLFGVLMTAVIGLCWRRALWRRDTPANQGSK